MESTNFVKMFIDAKCILDVNAQILDIEFKQKYLESLEKLNIRRQTPYRINCLLKELGFVRSRVNIKNTNNKYTTHFVIEGIKWK